MSVVYLDNNATTMPDPQVVQAMLPFYTQWYANPSSVHRFGQKSRQAIDEARHQVASLVGCNDSEILFTAGGTESINTALHSLLASRAPRRKIITTTVEHSATREYAQSLSPSLTYSPTPTDNATTHQVIQLPVNTLGQIDLDHLQSQLADDVACVTLLWANNETGTLFPAKQIAERCKKARVPLHVDATQVVGKLPVHLPDLGFDLMSFAAHKFHGPKGAGALYCRRGLRLRPLILGGPQERNRRGGTENVAGIVGLGVAAQLAAEFLAIPENTARIACLRDQLESGILQSIDQTRINGDTHARLPNTTNIGFAKLEAEAILMLLSEQNICASAGAACSSGSLEPSHVLKAMQIDPKYAHGSIRFSLSRYTTTQEIQTTLNQLPPIIQRLRKVLPV